MNQRARQIWRDIAEALHEKRVAYLQSDWRVLGQRYKWKDKVRCDARTNRLWEQFYQVELLLGESISDWQMPKMDLSRLFPLLPYKDKKAIIAMVKNAYNDVGDCNGIVEAELDYKDAIRIMEKL